MKVYKKEDPNVYTGYVSEYIGTFLRLEEGNVYYTEDDGSIKFLHHWEVIIKEDDTPNKNLLLG